MIRNSVLTCAGCSSGDESEGDISSEVNDIVGSSTSEDISSTEESEEISPEESGFQPSKLQQH